MGLTPISDREFNLFSMIGLGWLAYVRTDYRDSANNESHFYSPIIHTPPNQTCQKVMVMLYFLLNYHTNFANFGRAKKIL